MVKNQSIYLNESAIINNLKDNMFDFYGNFREQENKKDGKILLYAAPNPDVLYVCMYALAKAFTKLGFEVAIIDFSKKNWVKDLKEVLKENILFSVGFNGIGLNIKVSEDKYLYEMIDLVYVSLMVDAPYNDTTKDLHLPCNNLVVCYLDKTHNETIHFEFPHISMAMFMPWGGIPTKSYEEIFKQKKEFDLVYCAGFYGFPKKDWHDLNISTKMKKFLDEVAYCLENYPITVYDAFQIVMKAKNIQIPASVKNFYPFFNMIFWYIKKYRRLKCLETIASYGIEIDVFGGNWDSVAFANKLKIHQGCSYQASLELYTRSKVLVQENAEFNQGSHDRVYNAMLNGAVLVSEYSSYLDEIFIDGIELEMYTWQDPLDMVYKIENLLNNDEKRILIAKNAYKKAINNHTWESRAKQILRLIDIWKIK